MTYSWGRYPYEPQSLISPSWLDAKTLSSATAIAPSLPYGLGRSYGDSCLNSRGQLISSRYHDRILAFDEATGVLRAQAGLTIDEIITHFLPRGWFLPVTPGTKYVTLGGAIANDIHGKNHHRRGSFGNHVRSLELLRSDGSSTLCSQQQNSELFYATIGGLGLTGMIDWAEIQLMPIGSAFFDVEVIQFSDLDEFMKLEEDSHDRFEFTVSWIDGLAKGKNLGRGLYTRGNSRNDNIYAPLHRSPVPVPIDFPAWALNPLTVKGFNFAYYNKQLKKQAHGKAHYNPFFYPLDAIGQWNRIYGKKGFLQYQFVVPEEKGYQYLVKIMEVIVESKRGSFLNVLKRFGDIPSKGLISFPRPGFTYALDFAVNDDIFDLLNRLDELVLAAGGALYPAKDARMSKEIFQASFPNWTKLAELKDPMIQSDFWSRVTT